MASKIGPHVIIGPRKGFGEFLQTTKGKLAIVKCVDDFGAATEAKALDPNVLTVGRVNEARHYQTGQMVDMTAWEPRGAYKERTGAVLAAYDYYETVRPYWGRNPQIDVWETFNEFSFHWEWQGWFYIAMMDKAEQDGYILSHYCCSSGNPGTTAFANGMVESLREAKRRGHYLSLHSYGGVGSDIKTLRGTEPFHALRYRQTYNDVLIPASANPPLILSEIGQAGGFDYLGWDTLGPDLEWYDNELAKDAYVVGATLFTLGKWYQSNYQDALPQLAQHIVNFVPDITPPPVDPDPDPSIECQPRTPYNRRYHWVHIDALDWLKNEVWEIAKESGGTVGSSADDALYGPGLKSVTGIFYNVDVEEQPVFEAFQEVHYPDSFIEFITLSESNPVPPTTGNPLVGISIAIDGRHTTELGYEALKLIRPDTIKISTLSSFEEMDRLETIVPDVSRWTMRLYMAGNSDQLANPETFYEPQKAHIAKFRDMGGRDLEIYNEPNHPNEGMGTAWNGPDEFIQWYAFIATSIRGDFPNMKIGFPGLWPNPSVDVWLNSIGDDIARLSDIIYIHTYWQQRGVGQFGMANPVSGGRYWERFYKRFPKHRLSISECSNNHPSLAEVSYSTRGHELLDYMTASNWPSHMEAIFPYILELDGGQHVEQQWATPGNPIPSIIGGHDSI